MSEAIILYRGRGGVDTSPKMITTNQVYTAPVTGNYTIYTVGGGGGGGGGCRNAWNSSQVYYGAGGSRGGLDSRTIALTQGEQIQVNVGAGGYGGTNNSTVSSLNSRGTNGGSGGTSTFGSKASAAGGTWGGYSWYYSYLDSYISSWNNVIVQWNNRPTSWNNRITSWNNKVATWNNTYTWNNRVATWNNTYTWSNKVATWNNTFTWNNRITSWNNVQTTTNVQISPKQIVGHEGGSYAVSGNCGKEFICFWDNGYVVAEARKQLPQYAHTSGETYGSCPLCGEKIHWSWPPYYSTPSINYPQPSWNNTPRWTNTKVWNNKAATWNNQKVWNNKPKTWNNQKVWTNLPKTWNNVPTWTNTPTAWSNQPTWSNTPVWSSYWANSSTRCYSSIQQGSWWYKNDNAVLTSGTRTYSGDGGKSGSYGNSGFILVVPPKV